MAVKSASEIKSAIQTELADNNAGLISAYNVRHNMEDIVDSITQIVASGNFDSATPFTAANVRAKITGGQYGMFIAESGINFPNGGGTQYVPYPGPSNLSHNSLGGLTVGDPHTQYINVNGGRVMTGNLGMGSKWFNSSGNVDLLNTTFNDRGLKFEYTGPNSELMHIGNKTNVKFDVDSSTIQTAKGVAQAWIRFNGSGTMSVQSSYNVTKLERPLGPGSPGKFKVFFKNGLFDNGNYIAVAQSNSRSDNDNPEDFSINTVGIVDRTKDYITFYVLNDAGNYVDASMNDLVVYGNASGVTPDSTPTIVNN